VYTTQHFLSMTRSHAHALLLTCGIFIRYRELIKKILKKNYMAKDCYNLQYFQEKNYIDNFRKKNIKKPCRETL